MERREDLLLRASNYQSKGGQEIHINNSQLEDTEDFVPQSSCDEHFQVRNGGDKEDANENLTLRDLL